MHPKVALVIKNEIETYLVVGFIVAIDYSPKIFYIFPRARPNGEMRCTIFREINKSYP